MTAKQASFASTNGSLQVSEKAQFPVAAMKEKLASSEAWARRALEVLFDHQTADEQATGETVHHNKVGFSRFDAEILSSFARQVKDGRRLSERQMTIAHKRLPKYAGQLHRFAYGK